MRRRLFWGWLATRFSFQEALGRAKEQGRQIGALRATVDRFPNDEAVAELGGERIS